MNKFNLRDLTLDSIGEWPLVAQYFVALMLAVLIFVFGYTFFINPNMDLEADRKNQELKLKADFEKKQQSGINLQSYKNQVQIMNVRFGNMLKQLPSENEMPGLLEDISKTGIASGLTFELFAPKPEMTHDFYMELPIDIVVLGNYHQLAVFLSRVAEMTRIVTLHDFEITAVSKEKQKTNSGDLLEMKITAKIYRYKAKPIDLIPSNIPLAKFAYPEQDNRRSPFKPKEVEKVEDKLAPDSHKPKQPLERFSLDALKFVGIIKDGGVVWGLISQPDGTISRAKVDDYMGKNFGKIIFISSHSLTLEETVLVERTWQKKMTIFNLNASN